MIDKAVDIMKVKVKLESKEMLNREEKDFLLDYIDLLEKQNVVLSDTNSRLNYKIDTLKRSYTGLIDSI